MGRTRSRSASATRRRTSDRVGGYGGADAAARAIPRPPDRGARRSGYGGLQKRPQRVRARRPRGLPEGEAGGPGEEVRREGRDPRRASCAAPFYREAPSSSSLVLKSTDRKGGTPYP